MNITISSDYSETPGGRFRNKGDSSGEAFREDLLRPKYLEAKKNNQDLIVDLDGGYGYSTSFLEEAFGGLVRDLKDPDIKKIIKFVSIEEPSLIDQVKKYIEDELRKIKK